MINNINPQLYDNSTKDYLENQANFSMRERKMKYQLEMLRHLSGNREQNRSNISGKRSSDTLDVSEIAQQFLSQYKIQIEGMSVSAKNNGNNTGDFGEF